ncbi:MAG: DeoR family transcriptional regulator, partial [Candidatus Wildermuthbacteria bacterium]|nr:DeoR family transcriptional regulator [Candidatus Wildermuthbacteria bacterium]
ADFVFLTDNGIVSPSQKKAISERALSQIEKMEYLFWGAKGLGTVSAENFAVLERDYKTLREFCGNIPTVEAVRASFSEQRKEEKASFQASPKKQEERSAQLSSRQNKILEILRTKEKAQVWELQKVLPEVTKRTLRRDLDDLLEKKYIERHGEWNAVFYRIKRNQEIEQKQ